MVTTTIQIEVDEALLRETETILWDIGTTLPEAVTMMMHRIIAKKAIPFPIDCPYGPIIPNETTLAALAAAERGEFRSFDTIEDLMADLNAGECDATEAVLRDIGVTLPDAVAMMMRRIVAEKALPFPMDCPYCPIIPNETTLAALAAAGRGELISFDSMAEFMEWLDDGSHHMAAAREIARLGDTAAAVRAFAVLAENEQIEGEYRMEAAREIARVGDTAATVQAFSVLVEDDDIDEEYRMAAAQELFKLGDTPEGVDAIHAILTLATDYGIDLGINVVDYHINAARKIANRGIKEGIEILMSLVENKHDMFGAEDRIYAMQAIAELGDTDAMVRAFIALIRDDCVDESVLEKARQPLSQLVSALL